MGYGGFSVRRGGQSVARVSVLRSSSQLAASRFFSTSGVVRLRASRPEEKRRGDDDHRSSEAIEQQDDQTNQIPNNYHQSSSLHRSSEGRMAQSPRRRCRFVTNNRHHPTLNFLTAIPASVGLSRG